MTLAALLAAVAQAGIGVWFLAAAIGKAMDLHAAREAAEKYTVLGRVVSGLGFPILVLAEAAIGAGLVVGVGSQQVAAIAAAMLTMYAVVMAVDLARGLRHECGCGSRSLPISWRLVARNLAAVGILVASALWPQPLDLSGRLVVGLALMSCWILSLELRSARSVVWAEPGDG